MIKPEIVLDTCEEVIPFGRDMAQLKVERKVTRITGAVIWKLSDDKVFLKISPMEGVPHFGKV